MAERAKSEVVTTSAPVPVIERNTTTSSSSSTTLVPTNPFLDAKLLTEGGSFLMLVLGLGALLEKRGKDKREADKLAHKPEHDAIAKDLAELKHDLKNNETAINAVAAHRTSDVERIVKLEMRQENIEKGQARIEASMAKNHDDTLAQMRTLFDQVCDSVRELRDVKPR